MPEEAYIVAIFAVLGALTVAFFGGIVYYMIVDIIFPDKP